jgi:phospholipid/cholesterol/gamma-HCH transport system substrate-binding protein
MQNQSAIAVYVGIFVIIGLIVLMWLSLEVEGVSLGQDHTELIADFDDVLGLASGNPVTFRGVEIGKVGSMTLEEGTGRPLVTLRVRAEHELRENAVARLVQPDMLGQKTIDIAYPEEGPQGGVLQSGARIRTEASHDLASALRDFGEMMGGTTSDVRELIASFKENQDRAFAAVTSMVEDNRPRIDAVLASMEVTVPALGETAKAIGDVAMRVRDGDGTVARLLNDPNLADDFQSTVANLRDVSARLSASDGAAWRLLEDEQMAEDLTVSMSNLRSASETLSELFDGEMGTLAEDLGEIIPDLREFLNNMTEISGKINEGEGTIGKLVNDDALYTELRAALKRVNDTLEEAEETGVIRTFLAVMFGAVI